MSLRQSSAELRRSIFRTDDDGDASRAANLAVDYLDAFAPAVIEALMGEGLADGRGARLDDADDARLSCPATAERGN